MTASFVRHRRLYDACSGLKELIEISVFIIARSSLKKSVVQLSPKCSAYRRPTPITQIIQISQVVSHRAYLLGISTPNDPFLSPH